MADNNTIARPYAEAAFEVAREDGMLADWAEALEVAAAVMADGQVASFLANPGLSDAQRLDFLAGLFAAAGASTTVLAGDNRKGSNFLRLLLEYGRVAALPEIAARFEALKADVENTVDVTVTSAAPLSNADRELIVAALQKRLGREVRIETQLNEDLLGGAVIRAGDVVIDGSLRARLEGLAHALTA
jgi:F-type H+-transporting ATPase subunit delta